MDRDVIVNKCAAIERCLRRIQEEYEGRQANLFNNYTRQDAIILNLQRACQAAIDLAMHVVKDRRLGVPQESRDAFSLLVEHGVLDEHLGERLERMVGFRNVAIHDYQRLNLEIVDSILKHRLTDFTDFTSVMLKSLDPE